MNYNPNSIQSNITTHLKDLSSKLNDLINDSFQELAEKIGDCIFDNEILLISVDDKESDTYAKLTDQYAKCIDDIIISSYIYNLEKFDLAMNEYKNQVINIVNSKTHV